MKTKKITIEQYLQDPITLKTVIDTVLDPKNPDSEKVKKEIIKGINNCIKKDEAFLTTIKGIIIDNGESITKKFVQDCMDEYKEKLTDALVATVNYQCQEFFNERKDIINKILKKTLQECVQDIITCTKEVTDKQTKKLKKIQEKNTISLDIPVEHKDEIINYVNFVNQKK